ncbi:MAG: HAMP domain-containing sensor histidine kinase [Bacteroidota bacterium]
MNHYNIELKELNAAKDKLFSIIAHDLRNPFHSFLSLTQFIAEDAGSFSAEEISKIGSGMHQAAKHLFSLLKNLLEWAEMQKGTIEIEAEDFSLSGLISESVKMAMEMGGQKGIEIVDNVAAPAYAYADKKMINSVLLNLFSNAVKFTPQGGCVTISARETAEEMIEVSVKDTGIGIEDAIIGKLFMVGEKTSRTGTNGEPSTGIGLLLCKEFIEKNGGKIWVESKEGTGSTFSFTLRTHE